MLKEGQKTKCKKVVKRILLNKVKYFEMVLKQRERGRRRFTKRYRIEVDRIRQSRRLKRRGRRVKKFVEKGV